jgi:hypothetical protein
MRERLMKTIGLLILLGSASSAFAYNWAFVDLVLSPSELTAYHYCESAAAHAGFRLFKVEYEGPGYDNSFSWNCYGSN